MQKDASYHESAVQYNEELAEFADGLADRLKHPEVSRWARSVSKQHSFHAGRHKQALQKLANKAHTTVETDDAGEDHVIDDEKIVHHNRSSVTGEYVSEEEAKEHPDTTVTETDVAPVFSDAPDKN